MADPEVQRAAEFLAAHALLLLGLGLFVVALAMAAAVYAVRLVLRFKPLLLQRFDVVVGRAERLPALRRLFGRSTSLVPSAYVGVHLAVGLVLASGIAVFTALAEEVVTGGDMAAFDGAFARALQDERTPEGNRFFSAVSSLGTRDVLAAVTVAVAIVLISTRRIVLTVGWVAAQAGGGMLNAALKETFARTRPEFADPMLAAESWSFPSGHAMGTLVLCGVGCYLVVRELRSWTTAGVAIAASVAWCLVMAFSRLYLGVHYVSDVVAGFAAGLAWVAVCISALEVVRRRGTGGRLAGHGK